MGQKLLEFNAKMRKALGPAMLLFEEKQPHWAGSPDASLG